MKEKERKKERKKEREREREKEGRKEERKKKFDTGYNKGEPGGHHSQWSKLVTKGQILRDSIYMRYLE